MQCMTELVSLRYSVQSPPLIARRAFRRIILLSILLTVVISSWWWAPIISRRGRLLYWQHRCMVFDSSANSVIYHDLRNGALGAIPEEWAKFSSNLGLPSFTSDGMLFVHEMRKPNGERRLVAIDLRTWYGRSQPALPTVFFQIFKPGTLLHLPREIFAAGTSDNFVIDGPSPSGLTSPQTFVVAGRIDPIDETHFLITTKNGDVQTNMTAA